MSATIPKYLARTCPRCRDYFGVTVTQTPNSNGERPTSAVTQNRPLVITSKPANGRSVRDIDSAAKPFRLACEGFPYLYASTEHAQCTEELSQLRIQDIVQEFPDYIVIEQDTRLMIEHRQSHEMVAEARPVSLKMESIGSVTESKYPLPIDSVVTPANGKFQILTGLEEAVPEKRRTESRAYKIFQSGTLTSNKLAYVFEKDRIYNAAYSRFRFTWKENRQEPLSENALEVRQDLSGLLFRHLRQVNDFHSHMIRESVERGKLSIENIRLREELQKEWGFPGMVARSQAMHDLYSLLRSVAKTDLTVLVEGETGTGKELIAKAIHFESPRRIKRFMSINCGALSDTLLDSELFGHEKGAFTGALAQRKGIFEVANGGTLFLDEIGEITPGTQVRLLRVLQDGELQRVGGTETIKVDVRIIAATNKDLESLVGHGQFREDLYYRLNVFPMRVPPLRERAEDIPLLVAHFIDKSQERLRKEVTGISPDAMALLMAYSWPGNVRQLENTVQRMMAVAAGNTIAATDVPQDIAQQVKTKQELTSLNCPK